MSLYNALFGVNQLAPFLLKVLDIDQPKENAPKYPENWNPYDDGVTEEGAAYIKECKEKKYYTSGRFRDIYLNEDCTRIVLYTRNGGGNRESYPHIFSILSSHPNFIFDHDDDFDCTYAYYEFSVPEEYKELISGLKGEGSNPTQKFAAMMDALQNGEHTPETARAMQVGKKIFGEIQKAENGTVIEISPEDGNPPTNSPADNS